MKRVIQLVIEAEGAYCGKGEPSPSCPYYSGHSGMISFHHNCLAYHHGLLVEGYVQENGYWSSRVRRCVECFELDQGEASEEVIERLEASRAVQELRREKARKERADFERGM